MMAKILLLLGMFKNKINKLQFNVAIRRAYAKGTNHMQDIVDYCGENCNIPTSGNCFIKCINCFANENYTNEFKDFIKNEKYQPGVMTSARIQPFCLNYNIIIGCFDGTRINPRNITQRNTSLFIYNISV